MMSCRLREFWKTKWPAFKNFKPLTIQLLVRHQQSEKPTIQPHTHGCLSTTLVQGENVLHFDWLIKKQYAKPKILESREIIIAKTNFEPSKWQKENQNQRNKLYNMSLKLCEPKNILEKKGVLMLRHICYDTNGSALKASGTLMIH